jgi:hypothetical protein
MNIMIRDPTVLLYEFRFEQHGLRGVERWRPQS